MIYPILSGKKLVFFNLLFFSVKVTRGFMLCRDNKVNCQNLTCFKIENDFILFIATQEKFKGHCCENDFEIQSFKFRNS